MSSSIQNLLIIFHAEERKKTNQALYIGIALGKKDIGGFGFFNYYIAGRQTPLLSSINNIFFYQKRVSLKIYIYYSDYIIKWIE